MDNTETYPGDFELIGGRLCLDFANTMGGLRGGASQEYLHAYADLVAWSRQAGLVSGREAKRLIQEADRRSATVATIFERAISLRETIYRIFSAVTQGKPPAVADSAALNIELAEALARLQVVPTKEGFRWEWAVDEEALDRMLWPVVRSAADLLTSEQLSRVRECESDTCGWLFLDTTKNHSRRWCDMRGCGNRAKVHRHRERQRTRDAASA